MIAITSIVQNADGSWTFTWVQDLLATSYRVVLWGILLSQPTTNTYTWTGQEYVRYPPPLEVTSETDVAISETYRSYVVMQWYGESVLSYLVQQYVSGVWNTIDTVIDTQQWIYTYQTPILTDETSYQWRVIAVDAAGNQSTPRGFKHYMVTNPLPTDGHVVVGYSSGNITVVAN